MDSNGSIWVLIGPCSSLRFLMGPYRFLEVIVKFFLVFTSFCNTLRILMGLYWSLKVFIRAYGSLWVVVNPYASLCVIAPNKNNKDA